MQSQGENALIAISSAANLILIIPAILITVPSIPLPRALRRTTNPTLSKIVIYAVVIALSVLSSTVTAVLGDVLLVLSLLSTYVLPGKFYVVSPAHSIFNQFSSYLARYCTLLQTAVVYRTTHLTHACRCWRSRRG
jgi:hypothetical protein